MRTFKFSITFLGGKRMISFENNSLQQSINVATIRLQTIDKGSSKSTWRLNFLKRPNLIRAGKESVLKDPTDMEKVICKLFHRYNWDDVRNGAFGTVTIRPIPDTPIELSSLSVPAKS